VKSEFKRKKYFGPIPNNTFTFAIGFIDGPTMQLLAEHLDNYAKERNGMEEWNDWENSLFTRIGYEYQVTPNHTVRLSICYSHLEANSVGYYVAVGDTLTYLTTKRTFTTHLFSLEIGFAYYIVEPAPRKFSPYLGAGFSGVVPIEELKTEGLANGETPFPLPGENVSETSFEAGMHMEFGLIYYITNKYSASMEGRYQKTQSKFEIHGGNFDIDYSGFSLSIGFNYHF
jgi:opacity protein-like surface antigen